MRRLFQKSLPTHSVPSAQLHRQAPGRRAPELDKGLFTHKLSVDRVHGDRGLGAGQREGVRGSTGPFEATFEASSVP